MIEMKLCGPSVTAGDVARVEKNIGVRFPDDYRSFLIEVNGGRPADSNIEFPIRDSESRIHALFGVQMGEEMDVEEETLTGRRMLHIPAPLIPIGVDSTGDYICLGVAGDEAGRVYYRDSERVPDEPPRRPWTKMKGYVRIADSFSEFLAMLAPRAP